MTTLNTLAADVYTITNRPDLQPETFLALRKAVYKFHGAETFVRDLTYKIVDLSTITPVLEGSYTFDTSSDLPNLRRLCQISWGPNNTNVDIVAADKIFSSPRTQPYAYVAGQLVNLNKLPDTGLLTILYYKYPTVPPDPTAAITSWIADQFPDSIIEEASGTVFRMIGKDEEFTRYQSMFAENLAILKMADIGEES